LNSNLLIGQMKEKIEKEICDIGENAMQGNIMAHFSFGILNGI